MSLDKRKTIEFCKAVDDLSRKKVSWNKLENEEKLVLKSGTKDLKHHYERYGINFGSKNGRKLSSAC